LSVRVDLGLARLDRIIVLLDEEIKSLKEQRDLFSEKRSELARCEVMIND
jgi:hypothetical protein